MLDPDPGPYQMKTDPKHSLWGRTGFGIGDFKTHSKPFQKIFLSKKTAIVLYHSFWKKSAFPPASFSGPYFLVPVAAWRKKVKYNPSLTECYVQRLFRSS